MPAPLRSTHLECREGGHFKEYNIAIVPVGLAGGADGATQHDVAFSFGPIGSPNQGGKLNKNGPVPYGAAYALFDKQRRAKLAKGYQEVSFSGSTGAGAVTILSDVEKEKTDWLPQLCNDLDENQLERMLTSDNWCLEQKYDGKRIQVVKGYDGDEIYGINRKGEKVGLPEETVGRLKAIEGRVHLDGELIGLDYFAWDVVRRQGRTFTNEILEVRRDLLESAARSYPQAFVLARHARGTAAKRALLEELRNSNAEGGVFKLVGGFYKPGRPNSGGDWLRYKFWASASCRVLAADPKGKRSVLLALFDGEAWKYAGKVTIPPNFEVPAKDAVVECRYLYARKASGCLYQPIYLGERDDLGFTSCVQSQLKFKQGDEDEESEEA